MELSDTSETARESFSSAIILLSKYPAGEEGTAVTSSSVGVLARELGQGGSAGGGSGAAIADPAIGSAIDSPSVLPTERAAPQSGPRPPRRPIIFGALGNGAAAAGGGETRPAPAITDRRAHPVAAAGAADATRSSPSGYRDEAIEALVSVMRGLESRFVVRASPTPASQLSRSPSKAIDDAAAGRGRVGDDAAEGAGGSGDAAAGVEPESAAACREGVGGGRGQGDGWSIRVRSSRAEELLSDLLEREKAGLAQVNRDGARALERLAASVDKERAPSNAATAAGVAAPPFFLARTSCSSMTAAATAPAMVVLAGGRASGTEPASRDPGPTQGGSATSGVLRPRPPRRHRRHFPLELSGPGLGDKNSVFSMMLRGASLLGRHETAVLLAVRCAEHFLDASDVLASPRGALGLGGGGGGGRAGSPGIGKKRLGIGGDRNDCLGAVHLLLTSRAQGADRRGVDAVLTSACSEFLAHALAVVVWAVPHAIRAELFGDGGGDGGGGGNGDENGTEAAVAAAAAARRASVLRCLARLMRHSMKSDNPRVRDVGRGLRHRRDTAVGKSDNFSFDNYVQTVDLRGVVFNVAPLPRISELRSLTSALLRGKRLPW